MAAATPLQRIHHINFLVRDLEAAIARYQQWLGIEAIQVETLTKRGVKTARFRVGETWIVLVQPVDSSSIPAKHLESHGEGVFLVSCQVDNVVDTATELQGLGARVDSLEPRQGLDDWQVIDLSADAFFGVNLQLVQSERN